MQNNISTIYQRYTTSNTDSYSFYTSKGDNTFNCFFPLDSESELEVIVEQTKKEYLTDYTIEFLHQEIKKVKFNYLVGTENCPQKVTLKFKPQIERTGNFNNATNITPESLNSEFNNIITNQHYLQDNVERSVKVSPYQTDELILPIQNTGKCLLWDNEGNIVNSFENINETLDTLTHFMEDIQTNGSGGSGDGGSGIDIIDAFNVIYDGNIDAPNVQDALNLVSSAENITVIIPNMNVENVQDALIALTDSNNISYNNPDFLESSVKLALDSLNTKINDIVSGNIELLNQYTGVKHSLISGEISSSGLSNFLQSDSPFTVTLLADNNPLNISFSHFSSHQRGTINNNTELIFDASNIYYYIYADLQEDGSVSINYTVNKPYYLGYTRGDAVDDNQKLLLDPYTAPSDWFNISNYTMYNSNNQPIKRIYLGQVLFQEDGSTDYLVSNAYGDSYIFDFKITNSKDFTFNNLFSSELVSIVHTYKNVMPYMEDTLYSGNIHHIDASDDLESGVNYNINNHQITGVIGNPYANCYFTNSTTALKASSGYFRFFVKRLF